MIGTTASQVTWGGWKTLNPDSVYLLVQDVLFKCLKFGVDIYKKAQQSKNMIRLWPRSSSQKLLSESFNVFEWNGCCIRGLAKKIYLFLWRSVCKTVAIPRLHLKVKPIKMPIGLKSGLKKKWIKFWIQQYLVICSEAAKINHNLSVYVGASVVAMQRIRALRDQKFHERPQNDTCYQPGSACACELSQK